MSFTTAKDRIFNGYDRFAAWLARCPKPLRGLFYALIGGALWLAYALPGNSVRPTIKALAGHVGTTSAFRLFGGYVTGFLRGFERLERVRHGFGAEVDGLLSLPQQQQLEEILGQGGAILAMPHVHGSFSMTRALSQRYAVMSLIRVTHNKARSAAQWDLFRNVGCELHDVRHENPAKVARSVLRALKEGKIVLGMVDRMEYPLRNEGGSVGDLARAEAFGQPFGAPIWPARFAGKAGVPILPGIVVQRRGEIRLVLGPTVEATGDIAETTQAWVTEMELLIRAHPEEWAFWLDKNWSRLLRAEPPA